MAKYFTQDELQKVSCSPMHINQESLARLDRARALAGVPFVLTSAYRSPEHEKAKGRSGKGAHTLGRAFDIACTDSCSRSLIIQGALMAGFCRIGIGKTFIHVDDCQDLPYPRIWLY